MVSKWLGLSRRCHLTAYAISRVSLLIICSSLDLGFEVGQASLPFLAKSVAALRELSESLLAVVGWLHTFTAATDAVVVNAVLLPCRGVAVEASDSNAVGTLELERKGMVEVAVQPCERRMDGASTVEHLLRDVCSTGVAMEMDTCKDEAGVRGAVP